MKRRIVSLLFCALMCFTAILTPAYAVEAVGGGTAVSSSGATFTAPDNGSEDSNTGLSGNGSGSYSGYYGDIPSASEILGQDKDNVVTTKDVDNWVDRKGGELIILITHIVQVIAVIGFFVALGFIIVGALGDKRTMVCGFVGLILACVVFTAATCAPQIINAVSSWLQA